MLKNRWIAAVLSGAALVSTATFSACGPPHYRVYDPYYTDYHAWGPGEDVYYRRWVGERHYEYRDFRRLPAERQKEYWTWRHSQPAPDRR
jgi:hypothetical protein